MFNTLDRPGAFREFPDDRVGAFQRSAIRQLRGDNGIALILRGDESPGDDLKSEPGQPEQERVENQCDQGHADKAPDKTRVSADHFTKEPVKSLEEPAE
jgi:hypothetical protein